MSQPESVDSPLRLEPWPNRMGLGNRGGQRGLLVMVLGIVVLLVATVAIVALAGNRPPREYPAGSPEAAAQAYAKAWDAGDFDAAWQSFSVTARSGTTLDEYRRRAQDFGMWGDGPHGPSRRVFIDKVTVTGERASLELTIEETWGDGMSTSRNRFGRVLPMVREEGVWRFDRLFIGVDPQPHGFTH